MAVKYYRPENLEEMNETISSRFNDNIADIVCRRIKSATAKDWMSVDVESKDERTYRITIWVTQVGCESDFYDEWYSEMYQIDVCGENLLFEVDIR